MSGFLVLFLLLHNPGQLSLGMMAQQQWKGSSSGGDDPNDWGDKWKETPKHVGDGLPLFDEDDEDWEECEQECDQMPREFYNITDPPVPPQVINFPEHLEINSPHFRHGFFIASC